MLHVVLHYTRNGSIEARCNCLEFRFVLLLVDARKIRVRHYNSPPPDPHVLFRNRPGNASRSKRIVSLAVKLVRL